MEKNYKHMGKHIDRLMCFLFKKKKEKIDS